MQPLGTKNHGTIRDKKKSRNLLGPKKITEPLGTKKNFWNKNLSRNLSEQNKKILNLSRQKKSCNLSGWKKIPQPLGTKKLRNLLGRPIRKKRKSEEVGNRIKYKIRKTKKSEKKKKKK